MYVNCNVFRRCPKNNPSYKFIKLIRWSLVTFLPSWRFGGALYDYHKSDWDGTAELVLETQLQNNMGCHPTNSYKWNVHTTQY